MDSKSDALVAQVELIGQEERLTAQRIELAREEVERFDRLASSGFVSEALRQAKREVLIDWEARSLQTRRASRALQGEQRQLDGDRVAARVQFESEWAALRRGVQAAERELLENESRGREIVRAPRAGRIGTIHVPLGSSVRPQQVVAVFVPRESNTTAAPSLAAALYVPSRAMGFVAVGQDVWLRYAAFPYQKFGQQKGRVMQVDDSPTPLENLPSVARASMASARSTAEPLYRVRVAMVDQQLQAASRHLALRPGMLLDADVIQERRSVLEWIFEPLLAARHRISSP